MASRNRTDDFKRCRMNVEREFPITGDEDTTAMLPGHGDSLGHVIEMHEFPAEWSEAYAQVQRKMEKIEGKISEYISALQNYVEIFGNDYTQHVEQMKKKSSEIIAAMGTASKDIKELNIKSDNEATLKMMNNARNSLSLRLEKAMAKFNKRQSAFEEETRQKIKPNEQQEDLEHQLKTPGLTLEQQEEIESKIKDLREREKAINEIAQSIEQMKTMFMELNTMVVQQGTVMDNILHNIETAIVDVEKGEEELKKAQKVGKSMRNKMCVIILVICVLALAIAVVQHMIRKSQS